MNRSHADKNSVQIYLKQIENIPVLTREEEEVCAKKVSKGDRREKERLIVSNLRFVVSIAVRYQNLGLPLMDLINEGNRAWNGFYQILYQCPVSFLVNFQIFLINVHQLNNKIYPSAR